MQELGQRIYRVEDGIKKIANDLHGVEKNMASTAHLKQALAVF